MTDINKVIEPDYVQFEKLFTFRNEYGVDYAFVKKALNRFMRQFLYDLKYICKIRRRAARMQYKHNLEDIFANPEKAVIQAVEVVRQEIEHERTEQTDAPQETSKELALQSSKEIAEQAVDEGDTVAVAEE